MNKNEINNLILHSLSGEISEAEKSKLDLWLNDSYENKEYFEKTKKLWSSIQTPQPGAIPDFEEFWQGIDAKINFSENYNKPEKGFKNLANKLFHFFRRPSFAIAGLFSAVFAATLIYLFIFVFNKPTNIFYSTANAQQLEITLPDGSIVKLNSGSEIRFMSKFESERNVELKGEAYFNVTKSEKPFIIHTPNASVQVKGTKFNVKAREGKTRVDVSEGAVWLKSLNRNNPQIVLLTKGERSECVNDSAPIKSEKANTEKSILWLKNIIAFENTPLAEIAMELSRSYNVIITINDPALFNKTITGEFENQKIKDILSSICLSLGLQYKYDGNTYIIYSKK